MAEKTETVERGWNQAVRARERVCYNIFEARDMDNITGELGDVGKMACLHDREEWKRVWVRGL